MVSLNEQDFIHGYRENSSVRSGKLELRDYIVGFCNETIVDTLIEKLDKGMEEAFKQGAKEGRELIYQRQAYRVDSIGETTSPLEEKVDRFRQEYVLAIMDIDLPASSARVIGEYFMRLFQRFYLIGFTYGGLEAKKSISNTR